MNGRICYKHEKEKKITLKNASSKSNKTEAIESKKIYTSGEWE